MPVAIITGAGGLIGSEAVDHFIAEGFDVVGIENDMRANFFGPESSTAHVTERLVAEHSEFHWENADIRDADGDRADLPPSTPARSSWSSTPPPSPRTTGPRATPRPTSASTPTAPSTCSRPPAPTPPTPPSSSARPTRSTATPRTGCRCESQEQRLELPEDHPYYKGIDTSMSIDASTHSLFGVSKAAADLLVQEYGHYFEMPTVCFRGGCLTGPQHAGAKLHGFLAYLMKCTVTGTPYTVFGYEGKQVRDNIHSADLIAAFDAFRKAPRPHAVYNIGGGRFSNCSMLEAIEICERVAGRELSWEMGEEPRIGDHRWWISDLAPFQADYPELGAALRVEDILAGDARAEPRALDGGDGVKLSVVIPAQNEEGSVGATVEGLVATLEREGIDYEVVVVDDDSEDSTAAVVAAIGAENPRVRVHRSHYERGFGMAIRAGLDVFEGDAVAIVMADASDDPKDLVRYHRLLEEGWDCAFGSRFMPGARIYDYPRLKYVFNRLANQFIRVLFRHRYNDTTNAFKAYRREVIETVQPLLSKHFNLTVELPLKAIVRGHSYAVVPNSWTNRTSGEAEAGDEGDGQPLPVHRPLRLAREHAQPRRLPGRQAAASLVRRKDAVLQLAPAPHGGLHRRRGGRLRQHEFERAHFGGRPEVVERRSRRAACRAGAGHADRAPPVLRS